MLMYRIAHLACILAAAALCSGAAVEPRGDIRYDQPGSNLKEASISQPSGSGHNRGVTKDRRDYDRRDSSHRGPSAGEAPHSPKYRRDYDRRDYRLAGGAGGSPPRQEPPHSRHRRDYDRRDYRLAGGAGGSPPRQEPPHSKHRRGYAGGHYPPMGGSGGSAPEITNPHCSTCK